MEKNLRKNLLVVLVIAMAIAGRFLLEFLFNQVWDFFDLTSATGIFVRSLFVVIFILIWFSITLRSENPHQKLPWLLILTFEPVLGITLFMTFGRNFRQSYRYRRRPLMKQGNYITREESPQTLRIPEGSTDPTYTQFFTAAHRMSHHQPFIDNTRIDILKNGEAFYPELIKSIDAAKDFILFEFFILRSDTTGRKIVESLIRKAQEGVEVKIIIDALGSARTSWRFIRKIKKSNIDLVINDKIYFPLFNTRINYRNHRKIVVIDGHTGFTGGMNIADEYDNTIENDYYFRDTQIKLEGAAVRSLTALFFKDYYYNTNRFIDETRYYPQTTVRSEGLAQIVQSGPDSKNALIRNLYLKMIMTAKHSVKIMTPYLAMDQETLTALKVAAQSGVRVEIIVPGIPDKYIVYKVTKAYITTLLSDDVHIYQYEKGFCHAKLLIIDDTVASVGSYNLDNRSAVIDFEITALMTGPAVSTLLADFEADKQESTAIDEKEWNESRSFFTKFLEGIMSIFTPII